MDETATAKQIAYIEALRTRCTTTVEDLNNFDLDAWGNGNGTRRDEITANLLAANLPRKAEATIGERYEITRQRAIAARTADLDSITKAQASSFIDLLK